MSLSSTKSCQIDPSLPIYRGGFRFLIENPRGGWGGPGGGGAEGLGECPAANWGIQGGGGAKYFFGAEMATKVVF